MTKRNLSSDDETAECASCHVPFFLDMLTLEDDRHFCTPCLHEYRGDTSAVRVLERGPFPGDLHIKVELDSRGCETGRFIISGSNAHLWTSGPYTAPDFDALCAFMRGYFEAPVRTTTEEEL